jgi:glycerate kinase
VSAAPVLVAPDKFKGTLTAAEVAAAIAAGLREAGREVYELPVADGGEGTAPALGGTPVAVSASDPLGRPVEASYAWVDDGTTAIVEAADASGLWRLAPSERDPFAATSAGTGELIAAAVEAGSRHVMVACGGTATIDGGKGLLDALGEKPRGVRFTAICDVRTPWEQAASEFGPQKGANRDAVTRLDRRLAGRARAMRKDPRGVPMTGCGRALVGARRRSGGRPLLRARRARFRRPHAAVGIRRDRRGKARRDDPRG